mmetsp:Transcript_49096/g.59482  ORF Transcript_49096/g.59482 Transcript_49096/m.59482 type:complete len:120 (+) Transcript_49096:125-484(+)|eukprot:CAMPEP_0172500860 /NCGR_PEP_ID=MMETSP1066-20121228/143955_1 /TAXON_ID=671091 /ORGANISM="Coscinodiscus wailesii, Strain CCMP2513" /LENGTH=119 /DNA_ID=CAMNT_0013275341 /DNA_START=107 /DNA_END=466 /DNA_ORIENTATION=+
MASAAEVFAAMGEAVKGDGGKKLQKKFKGTVVFTIDGEKYSLDLKSSDCTVAKGDDGMPKPDLYVTISEKDFMKLIDGSLNPQQAFMKGKLKIKGKMALAMKFTSVLAATKKALPRSKL